MTEPEEIQIPIAELRCHGFETTDVADFGGIQAEVGKRSVEKASAPERTP